MLVAERAVLREKLCQELKKESSTDFFAGRVTDNIISSS